MSKHAIRAFVAKVEKDEELRKKVRGNRKELLLIAKTQGFEFTAKEFAEYIEEKVKAKECKGKIDPLYLSELPGF